MRKLVIRSTACCLLSTCLVAGTTVLGNAKNTAADLPTVGIANVLSDYCTTDSKLPSAGVTLTLDEYAVSSADTELRNSVSKVSEEYRTLVIAQVDGYANVREEANVEAEVVGKLYNNAAATILGEEGNWYEITSGNVTGFVSKDCVVAGEEAQFVGQQVGERIATATSALNVFAAMDVTSEALYVVETNETMAVLEELEGFVRVAYADAEGYVLTDAVVLSTKFDQAETLEEEAERLEREEAARKAKEEAEEAKRLAEEAEAEEARKAAEEAEAAARRAEEARNAEEARQAAEEAEAARQEAEAANRESASNSSNSSSSSSNSSSSSSSSSSYNSADSYSDSSKGQQIANYALQFVGNPYVWGGTSLTNGADCSGFVMSVFSDCGVGVAGRTASAQSTGGTSISASQLQAGDLVFYRSGGRVSHVAIYIGDGKIVHAANSRKGIIVSSYNYQTPYKFVRYY